jgi:hypothetical protein
MFVNHHKHAGMPGTSDCQGKHMRCLPGDCTYIFSDSRKLFAFTYLPESKISENAVKAREATQYMDNSFVGRVFFTNPQPLSGVVWLHNVLAFFPLFAPAS